MMRPILYRDAATLLARALVADAAAHGIAAAVRDWASHPWASATFTGDRHRAVLTVAGDASGWLAGLREAELALRGYLIADLVATNAGDGLITVEALTLDLA